ncbi:MAG TPA: pilus assembly protein PilO, partial [Azospira sp.]|nr:pilus assembly protein PilO [Azospira sp.]
MKKIAMPNVDLQGLLDDFRRLNPNDVGTWPLIPKVTALVGVFAVLLAAGWWFVWQDQLDA